MTRLENSPTNTICHNVMGVVISAWVGIAALFVGGVFNAMITHKAESCGDCNSVWWFSVTLATAQFLLALILMFITIFLL